MGIVILVTRGEELKILMMCLDEDINIDEEINYAFGDNKLFFYVLYSS